MDAAQVLETLMSLRISLRAEGNKLLLEPGSKVPPELVPDLQRCKPEILQLLNGPHPSFDYGTTHLLAWAAHAAEVGLTLPEPVLFLETPLRPYTTADVGRYCRDQLTAIAMAFWSRCAYGYFFHGWRRVSDMLALGCVLFTACACLGWVLCVVIGLRTDQYTRCRKCRYVLRGITEPRCPECGEEFEKT